MKSSRVAVVLVTTAACHAAGFEVICDSLCMTDLQVHDSYYLSYCGGRELYGESYSLQAADTFRLSDSYFITNVTVDFLTLHGTEPDYVCASFYEFIGGGCSQSEEAAWLLAVDPSRFSWEPFEETVFNGLQGRRAAVSFVEPPRLSDGLWLACLQPAGEADFGGPAAISYAKAIAFECIQIGSATWRESNKDESCCVADGDWGDSKDWTCDGSFEPDTLSMRIEGIPAGDCVGGERMRARCKVRDGEQVGDVVAKVRNGQPEGTVTALLDPPDPRSMSIPLDDRGRGKGKFKDLPLGEHRVFVCDSIVDVICAP